MGSGTARKEESGSQLGREGPYRRFPRGRYQGVPIEEVIRKDPRYVMWAIRDWLDVSPQQATLFTRITGGEIPPRFVKPSPLQGEEWTERDLHVYWSNQDLVPNYDFYGEGPSWWEEYKRRVKGETHPAKRLSLYQEYVRRDFSQIRDSLK